MELYLIRHTRPAVPEGTCYGRTDVPLDEPMFVAGIEHLAAHLPAGMRFHTSPATRCARFADMLAQRTAGTQAAADVRLHELDFGAWEGRAWRDLPCDETEAWTADIVNRTPPGGENFMALWQRVAAFHREVVEAALDAGAAHLAIVGHAGSLKVLVLRALGLPPGRYGQADLAQGRVTRIDLSRGGDGSLVERLMFLNR